eukprot:1748261-Rhodomonas_salina.1
MSQARAPGLGWVGSFAEGNVLVKGCCWASWPVPGRGLDTYMDMGGMISVGMGGGKQKFPCQLLSECAACVCAMPECFYAAH